MCRAVERKAVATLTGYDSDHGVMRTGSTLAEAVMFDELIEGESAGHGWSPGRDPKEKLRGCSQCVDRVNDLGPERVGYGTLRDWSNALHVISLCAGEEPETNLEGTAAIVSDTTKNVQQVQVCRCDSSSGFLKNLGHGVALSWLKKNGSEYTRSSSSVWEGRRVQGISNWSCYFEEQTKLPASFLYWILLEESCC